LNTYSRYFISLLAVLGIVNFLLAIYGQKDFSIYFILNIIAFAVVTLFFKLDSRAMSVIHVVSAVLFVGFLFLVAYKIVMNL
jgi:hypothetical protein